jgi:hypothetical protein
MTFQSKLIPIDVLDSHDHAIRSILVNQENQVVFHPIENPFAVTQLFIQAFPYP